MAEFLFYGRRVTNIFRLLPRLGTLEDDMTRASGWTLAQCPAFLSALISKVTGKSFDCEAAVLDFQVIEKETGRTDLEITIPGLLHMIAESKRGWQLPTDAQLTQYAIRLARSRSKHKHIVVLTDCSPIYTGAHFLIKTLKGIPLHTMSWAQLTQVASDSRSACGLHQRNLIDNLLEYLRGLITMQQLDSNWVYVLSLGADTPEGWKISWIDIVNKKHRYFHPVGGNWPGEPANYIAFRYSGELQSIHRVEGFEVAVDINDVIPEVPRGAVTSPHYVYKLGKAFRPDHRVPTGSNIHMAARRWCMLDTLFTCETISDANRVSIERQSSAPEFAPR